MTFRKSNTQAAWRRRTDVHVVVFDGDVKGCHAGGVLGRHVAALLHDPHDRLVAAGLDGVVERPAALAVHGVHVAALGQEELHASHCAASASHQ